MERPLFEFKCIGRKLHSIVKQIAKERGIDFIAGPQGQVLYFVDYHEKIGKQSQIKDIETELDISKSVASNLIKRMEKNQLISVEPSEIDKRAKHIRLTKRSREIMGEAKSFFKEIDECMLRDVSPEDLAIFSKVIRKFYNNIETLEKGE
ncbi:MAG: MarR family winged helix-turn-helix transcriptional regulator [Streptococcus sp.]|nr:MarR family winged helix-turn-helix transcriptional regulator [Streptococcus sp.]